MSLNEWVSQGAITCMTWAKKISNPSSASFPAFARICIFIIIIADLYSVPAHATSWAAPGETLLRHDLQLLADSGLLPLPLTTWPVSWQDIRQSVDNLTQASAGKHFNDNTAVQQALARIRYHLVILSHRGHAAWKAKLTAVTDQSPKCGKWSLPASLPPATLALPCTSQDAQELPAIPFRTFTATPRAQGELEVRVEGGNQHIAYRMQAQAVSEPEDGQTLRLDGSYATLLLGNWGVTLGTLERWWGPGWDGSLILSNNARPLPGLTIQRIISDPFPWQPLSPLGPWQLVFFTGLLEEGRADISNALLTTVRLNFKPTPYLEIGLSRAAQWGGEGRSEDIHTFFNMLLGQDNNADTGGYFEPGNQLAGYDVRWVSPVFNLPYAIYGQLIGEDEAGNLPYKFIGLGGMEWWGTTTSGGAASYRLHVEYADTAVDFYKSPKFNIAYRHHLYSEGYVYRDRFLGHTAGGDARSLTVGGLLANSDSSHWEGLLRWIQTGRANTPAEHSSFEVRYTTKMQKADQYQISVGLFNQEAETEARAFLGWTHAF